MTFFFSIIWKKPIGFESLQKLAYFEWNTSKFKKRIWNLKKVKFSKWIKFSNNIYWVSEMSFGPRGVLRKRFGPIWMYSQRFYENEKNRFFSNFTWFLKPHRRLRLELSSRVMNKCSQDRQGLIFGQISNYFSRFKKHFAKNSKRLKFISILNSKEFLSDFWRKLFFTTKNCRRSI